MDYANIIFSEYNFASAIRNLILKIISSSFHFLKFNFHSFSFCEFMWKCTCVSVCVSVCVCVWVWVFGWVCVSVSVYMILNVYGNNRLWRDIISLPCKISRSKTHSKKFLLKDVHICIYYSYIYSYLEYEEYKPIVHSSSFSFKKHFLHLNNEIWLNKLYLIYYEPHM